MPRFSIVIATFNQSEYLSACLDSALAQSYTDFEIVVVNDGSSDQTRALLDDYASRFPKQFAHVIHAPANLGQAHAWNAGIARARGELIAFLDSDDIWSQDKLKIVNETFGDDAETVMHQHNLYLMRGGNLTGERFCRSLLLGDVSTELNDSGNFVPLASQAPASALTFSRNALGQIGPIPGSFQISADAYLRWTVIAFGRVSGTDACLGAYRVHDRNSNYQNKTFDTDRFIEELLRPELKAFYQRNGREARFLANPADQRSPLAMLNFRERERALLIRSVPPFRIHELLSQMRTLFPDVGFDLLVQENMLEQFSENGVGLLAMRPGMLGPESIPDGTRDIIARRNYACILVPYLNDTGKDYENVHAAAASLATKAAIFGVGISNRISLVRKRKSCNETIGASGGKGGKKPRQSWAKLRRCHAGKRAFVIGNGPSLNVADLERLRGEITFASNKIYLAFDEAVWRPTYYTVIDHLVAANNADRIRRLDLQMLLPEALRRFEVANASVLWYLENGDNAYMKNLPPHELAATVPRFTKDAAFGLQGGFTVIYHQLQLAWHMGIREVYLIGVDFSFSVPSTVKVDERFKSAEYRNALVSNGEINHFHPDYRAPGETWSMPRLDLQARAFHAARLAFEADGGFLLNASRKTALNALETIDFDSLF